MFIGHHEQPTISEKVEVRSSKSTQGSDTA